jgi:hypothetical protein
MQDKHTALVCPFCHAPLSKQRARFCGKCGMQLPQDEGVTVLSPTVQLGEPTVFASPPKHPAPSVDQTVPSPSSYNQQHHGQYFYDQRNYEQDQQHERPSKGNEWGKRLSSSLFGAIVICFFLPFLTISCGSQEMTVKGIELVTDSHTTASNIRSLPFTIVVPAVLIGIALVVGFVAGFLRYPTTAPALGAIAGVLGAASMVALKLAITNEILSPNTADDPTNGGIGLGQLPGLAEDLLKKTGLIQVEYHMGYWLALSLFVVALAVNIWLLVRYRRGSP